MTIPHPIRVAMHFRPHTHAFWLGLFHDTVEDGYLPRALCRYWPALDAITRREGEFYHGEYIPRCASHPVALEVKRADVAENLKRCEADPSGRYSLHTRYVRASAALAEYRP